jgi:hypothetical protein
VSADSAGRFDAQAEGVVSMKTQQSRAERGRFPLQLAMAFAISAVVAVLAGAFGPQRWASAGLEGSPLHGITLAKGCSTTPAVVGDAYSCRYTIGNFIDNAPDTLQIQSLIDRIDVEGNGFGQPGAAGDVESPNLLPLLTLTLAGGATCDGPPVTECTLPPGSSITSDFYSFYNTDADDPNPLSDRVYLAWTDTCDSKVLNCPVGPQRATTGSQQAVHSPTPSITPTNTPTNTSTPPSNTSTPSDREERTNTPTKTNTPPPADTPTPASSVLPATVVPPAPAANTPTTVPSGTVTLPAAGSGSGGNSSLLVGLVAGVATFGLLLVMGRARAIGAPRYRGKP